MADIKMNQFTSTTEVSYIYAEAANGSQVKISIGSLIAAILGNSVFRNRGIVEEGFDFNNAKSGVYTVNKTNCTNQPFPAIGTLVSFNDSYKLQVFMCIADGSQMFMRVSDVHYWAPWRKIQSVSL